MIIFNVRAGTLSTPDGIVHGKAFSGNHDGLNNPDMEQVEGVGPIPRGLYNIGEPRDGGHLGPFVMNLDPCPGTDVFGRSLFRIHGDSANDFDKTASHGCIVTSRMTREFINGLSDRRVRVI
jgi:hypothetical protein